MKTDQLIKLMVEDAPVQGRLGQRLAAAITLGIGVSFLVLVVTVGLRADLVEAIGSPRVVFKIATTVLLAAISAGLIFIIARPGGSTDRKQLLLAGPIMLLALGAVAELLAVTPDTWQSRMMGNNARFCLFFIPILALPSFAAFLVALRHAAPDSPGGAGGVAGLASGAIASAIYAWHCPDDSPLFVATWYSLAIAIVTVLGYVTGKKLLRW